MCVLQRIIFFKKNTTFCLYLSYYGEKNLDPKSIGFPVRSFPQRHRTQVIFGSHFPQRHQTRGVPWGLMELGGGAGTESQPAAGVALGLAESDIQPTGNPILEGSLAGVPSSNSSMSSASGGGIPMILPRDLGGSRLQLRC